MAKKERTWVDKYISRFNLERMATLLYFFVPLCLSFIFGFKGGEAVSYINDDGQRVVEAAHPLLVIFAIICSGLSVVGFIVMAIAIMHTRTEIEEHKGHKVMAYILNKKCKLIIDGVEQESIRRMNYKDFVFLNGVTDDGIKVTCKVSARNTSFLYEDPNETGKTVIVNKYNRSRNKKNNEELTPMQKKLIEHAKTDTLASIDASDPETAKKKIDLYHELDELDD